MVALMHLKCALHDNAFTKVANCCNESSLLIVFRLIRLLCPLFVYRKHRHRSNISALLFTCSVIEPVETKSIFFSL